jgi:hypothetical protein
MPRDKLQYSPVDGKTYTLFGNTGETSYYYKKIKLLADKILEKYPDKLTVIETIEKYSSKKRYLRKILKNSEHGTLISDCLNLIDPELQQFTQRTAEHLKNLSPLKFWDKRLRTNREQYHLYMLEIELTNRFFGENFKKSDKKIALLPYCLQDFSVNCKAVKSGYDYQCIHCSARCFQNFGSSILEKNHIEPFIWMSSDLKQLAKSTLINRQKVSVLGIACIPELVWGMRKCREYNIPVMGIPLNANRCVRWFGEFFPNSIDLNELETLTNA